MPSETTASGIEVGDRVHHKREVTLTGTVRHVDHGYEIGGDVTTCEVEWDMALITRDEFEGYLRSMQNVE